ncbi:MAG: HD domain-containing protein [Lachnospiraceae bacterium]|nr:HD domain-containing protein [Lachnospiraceae bacterium]
MSVNQTLIEILIKHQLNIMLSMGSICFITAIFVYFTTSLSKERKKALMLVEIFSMLLLLCDRMAYIYRGDVSEKGYWMVRISNFMVYLMSLSNLYGFNKYISDLFINEGGLKEIPKRLRVAEIMYLAGVIMLLIAQFTGFYYTFDETNHYRRSSGFLVCYMIPLIIVFIQLSAIIRYGKKIDKYIRISLFMFTIIPLIATIVQIFMYGVSLTNMASVGMSVILYLFALSDLNRRVDRANRIEIDYLKEEQKVTYRLFDQVAKAFVNAIDARDVYSQGHSLRVARYSREIARKQGLSEKECQEVYYSALLHDVGKLSIPDSLLEKEEDLTEEEKEIVRHNPIVGNQILSDIKEFPYLATGAHYYKEKYDGSGYPEGLKGEEIPYIARIISVADAYDSMIQGTGWRNPMPDIMVREELIKESGKKYDPDYVGIMVDLIDNEKEFLLGNQETGEFSWKNEMQCFEYRTSISRGIKITSKTVKISFKSKPEGKGKKEFSVPSLIFFDSFDACVHDTEKTVELNQYLEYGELWFDGHIVNTSARDMIIKEWVGDLNENTEEPKEEDNTIYEIEAVKFRDHVRIRLHNGNNRFEVTAALPDNSRWAYLGITGEYCYISDIEINETDEEIKEGDIQRIKEEISYIDHLEGDIPNVQIDGTFSAFTEGVPLTEDMRISFHTMSLPTANLVWHCPYILLYSSKDGKINGPDYEKLALFSLNGESKNNDTAQNKFETDISENFEGWDSWKIKNKKGFNCTVLFSRSGNKINVSSQNFGVSIHNITTLNNRKKMVYVALTGEQCAITNIMVM